VISEVPQILFSASTWAHGLLTDKPDRVLMISDGKRITAATLAEEVGRYRAALNFSGIGAGQIVAISAERSVSSVAVLLACLCEGASPFWVDSRQDHDVLSKLFDTLRIHGLYCGTSLDSNGFKARLPYLRWVGDSGSQLQASRINPPEPADDASFYLHTAGTCGLPKAFQHSAEAIEWQAKALTTALRLGAKTEVWFTGCLALSSVFALGFCAALAAGGTLVLDDPESKLNEAPRTNESQRILLLSQTSDPSTWNADKLLRVKGKVSAIMTSDFSLSESYATTLAQATDAAIWNGYSLAEAAGFLAVNPIPGVWPTESVGRPIGGAELESCSREGERNTLGDLGRLTYHYAPAPTKVVSLTFQSKSELRAEVNVTTDWGIHDTSDFLFVVGNEKMVFYRAGFPIDAGQVELLLRQVEGVDESIVYALPDDEVESEVAVCVASRNDSLDLKRIHSLSSDVPRYLLPVRVAMVEKLFRTPTGKVIRYGLPTPSKIPGPSKESKAYIAPAAAQMPADGTSEE